MRRNSISSLKLLITTVMISAGLTGCGNQIPDMTDAQAKQIGEYAAVTLLKYDANHRSRLVDEETIAAYDKKQQEIKAWKEQQNVTSETVGMNPVEDTPTVELGGQTSSQQSVKTIAESLAVPEGIGVTYLGHKLCESYPDNGSAGEYFSLDASNGKKILVLEFSVENPTTSNADVDFFAKDAAYSVKVGDGKQYSAMTTMLLDDMSTYTGTIKAGESQHMVLLFEVEQSVAENITDVQLYFKNNSQTYMINM